MKTTHTPFDAAAYLDSPEMVAAYIEASLEEGDLEQFKEALNNVARAKGMAEIAAETGISRPGVYKALAREGNPSVQTVSKILGAFNLRFSVEPISRRPHAA